MTINDKWIWASLLQKAVRRGNTQHALQAVTALWELDRPKLWARLPIIALEDVGIGNPDAVAATLLAVSSAAERRDKQTALHLTSLLCAGAKNRLADAVFILSERSATYHEVRQHMARVSDDELIDTILNSDKPLIERTIAAWLLAGTQKFPSEVMPLRRKGNVDKAIAAILALTPSTPLNEACAGNIKSSRWPLSLHLPLIAQEAMKYDTSILHHPIPADTIASSLDIFTKAGRLCFRQLRDSVSGLKPYTIQQIGLGIFYLDGGKVDKELTSPELQAIQQAGELTDLESAGLSQPEYMQLRALLMQHMELLTAIRHEHLNAIKGKPTFTHSGEHGGAV